MKIFVIILLIIGYLTFGAFGSYLLAKDLKRSFGEIEGSDIPAILFCGLCIGYGGFLVGLFCYYEDFIKTFFDKHCKTLTSFINRIVKVEND